MNKKEIQAVFIDRDGTIGGTGHFIHPRDFNLYSYSEEAFRLLKTNNMKMFACTNQWRINRGEVAMSDFHNEFKSYGFDDAFICPHGLDDGCECRKPKSGLLLEASKKHHLDLTKTVFIGDTGTDMLAADAVGVTKILVLTGWGRSCLGEYRHTWENAEPDYIAENLLEAVKWVVNEN